MILLLVLMLPLFLVCALVYLLMTLGDAITTAAGDWVEARGGSDE